MTYNIVDDHPNQSETTKTKQKVDDDDDDESAVETQRHTSPIIIGASVYRSSTSQCGVFLPDEDGGRFASSSQVHFVGLRGGK